jgi:hypothetical protein
LVADILNLSNEGRTNSTPLRPPSRYGAGRVNPFVVSNEFAGSSGPQVVAPVSRTRVSNHPQGARTDTDEDVEMNIRPDDSTVENHANGPVEVDSSPPAASETGYNALAAFMASDAVFRIFRRFDVLAVRSLLYLQDELCELEDRLNALDDADLKSGNHAQMVSLHSRRHDQNQQRKLLLAEIQVKLTAYCMWRRSDNDCS